MRRIDAIQQGQQFLVVAARQVRQRIEGSEQFVRFGFIDVENQHRHALVGPGSLHAATLHGGSGLSTYAAKCTLEIERRTIPGESEADVVLPLRKMIDALSAADPNFHAELKTTCVRDAFEVPKSTAIVQTLARTATAVLGSEPKYVGDTPWMDSALLAQAGVETVVMGPSGGGAHADEEWVDINSVEKMAEILAATAAAYCG